MPAWRFPASWQTLNQGDADQLTKAKKAGAVEVALPKVPKGQKVAPFSLSPMCEPTVPGCGDTDADD